ncbi:snake venom 5'-nucleotidase isoform X1 [Phlebotomus argentipes]|uniref:snake venom 5'-nucleotidase isoform X1 n=1 Tax=Phlebotomus argentipes TaxID=94469 RepID=UPI0028932D04|nr:snake venom 5'-nucleotidase isoform X1 [Phlebotomus argentipes]XP_059616060.1 snake venom 5'-nucleotidase isoform X1 [Phlebotomus argentipes]
MAGFAAQAALRSKWGDLVDSGSASLPEPHEVSQSLKNVVGWLKQASIEVREAGKRAVTTLQNTHPSSVIARKEAGMETLAERDAPVSSIVHCNSHSPHREVQALSKDGITILHFNDVYNIEPNSVAEPIGGAARFATAIHSFRDLKPLVLFSGDAFSPSMLSTYTQGEQMIPVLNAVSVKCAVFGNHDFDHGLDVLSKWVDRCHFPWLMSNVVDNETGRPLGDGKITHIMRYGEHKIGFVGLVERQWLETLPTIDPKEVTFIDFSKAAHELAAELRKEGCDIVIALTHMRTPNDEELARQCPEIDLILGGHDHVFEVVKVNGTNIVKSGTDFRQFSKIAIENERDADGRLKMEIERVDVTASYSEDETLKAELEKYSATIELRMEEVLGTFSVELDGRFSQIRTMETNLGDWVCDVILAATGADVVLINSGTFRSDQVHPAGPFKMRDLVNIVPMRDPLIVLEMSGQVLLQALENAVSAYPKLEGRFFQVSGLSFVFDPSQPPGKRVEAGLVRVADEWLNLEQNYAVCIKSYIHSGCDGFHMFKECKVLMDEDSCPELGLAIQNHFKAIDVRMGKGRPSKHRQSLVTLSRRHSTVQMMDSVELDGPTPVRRISMQKSLDSVPKLLRRTSMDDLEQASCQLAPEIQHRIISAQNSEHVQELLRRRETQEKNTVIKEVDEYS